MSFNEDLRKVERVTTAFCVPVFTLTIGLLVFSLFL